MENLNKTSSNPKQRHGCVTAWLILMIIANSLTAILYLFFGNLLAQGLPETVSHSTLVILAILGLINVISSVLLLRWMKIGFWIFLFTSIAALVINLTMGLGVIQSFFGLVGIAILYGVLQIKENNVSAWTNLGYRNEQIKPVKNSAFKSAKTIYKEKLEEEERLKKQAEEEAERLKRRAENEDPSRFMPN
ncbi:MAG: hypothetical protein ACK5JD_00895 [Mangrovibacterium sp.]